MEVQVHVRSTQNTHPPTHPPTLNIYPPTLNIYPPTGILLNNSAWGELRCGVESMRGGYVGR
jgi:hypothetical protein